MRLYDSLDLKLHKFIACLCDGDFSVLIIEGEPSELELILCWEKVYEAFLDAMKDRDGLHRMRLKAQINHLEFNYKFIHLCLERLQVGYSAFVEECLRRLIRVDGSLNPEDQDRYFRALEVVRGRAQRLQVEIGEKKAEEAILEKGMSATRVRPTKEHFDNLIGQVSRFMHFYIDRRRISTGEFVSFYVQMRQEADAISNLQKSR